MDIKTRRPLTHDMETYRKKYYEEHKKDSYKEELICELCGGKYKRYNKTHHNNTKRHKELQDYNKIKNELEELKNKIKNLV